MTKEAAPTMRLERVRALAELLYVQRIKGFQVPDAPHFDPASQPFFLDCLDRARSYLEYGSGGSTVLAGRSGKVFTTVDSDRFFLDQVRRKVGDDGAAGRFIYADIGITGEWGYPLFRRITPARLRRWRRYAELPFEGGGFTPDLILVDGRFRVACALVTTRELRHLPGTTLLIDDYAGRPHYHEVERFAELLAMHGRMAEFAIRPHVDRAALDRSIEQHARDWR